MRKQQKLFCVMGGILISLSTSAIANDNGLYVLAGAGQATKSVDKAALDSAITNAGATGFTSSAQDPTVYGVKLGYKLNQNFAVEGSYIGSNNATYTASGGNLAAPVNVSAKISGWDLAAVGLLPLTEQFSLLGRVGIADIKSSGSVSGAGGALSVSGSKSDLTYGVGAQLSLTDGVFTRFSIDSYKIGTSASSSRSNVWSVNIGVSF